MPDRSQGIPMPDRSQGILYPTVARASYARLIDI
jgi:hypothetical protein